MSKNTRWVCKRKSSDELYHSGTKGMKWGYNDGKPNGKRKAADEMSPEAKEAQKKYIKLYDEVQTLRDKLDACNWENEELKNQYKKVYNDMLSADDELQKAMGSEPSRISGESLAGKIDYNKEQKKINDTLDKQNKNHAKVTVNNANRKKYVKNIVSNDGFKTLSPDIQRKLLKELND